MRPSWHFSCPIRKIRFPAEFKPDNSFLLSTRVPNIGFGIEFYFAAPPRASFRSMSIDIDWESLTTGPEGLALAVSIKDFIHAKFQQVELPRFIRSVQVHSFDFGKESPVIELKDICDPLPDFYENDHEEEGEEEEQQVEDDANEDQGGGKSCSNSLNPPQESHNPLHSLPKAKIPYSSSKPTFFDTRPAGLRLNLRLPDHVTPPLLRSSTSGIPGGTSNLSYFHLPLSAGISGTQTPLAAVASGTPYSAGWDFTGNYFSHSQHHHLPPTDSSSRPSTADSFPESHQTISEKDGLGDQKANTAKTATPDPMDTQVVLHIAYSGTVCLSITAEILLDYPMPSFVGIPLKLNITGLSFDGVALIAYLRKRAHFCFLGPEDAQALVGVGGQNGIEEDGLDRRNRDKTKNRNDALGGLLREIQVESEIGRKEGGKQVLKNVGKVEKFVLEQVRRIFEEEFVWPSFWTFLV